MGFRGKLICLLIAYFAGFATAIYCLSPVPEEQAALYGQQGFPQSAVKSDWFAKSANAAIRKLLDFSHAAASETIQKIKQKAAEKPAENTPPQSAGLDR
jgi:hypothetical protein